MIKMKEMKKTGKIFSLIVIFTLVTITTGYAQSPIQEEPTMDMREMAREEADFWSTELGLTEKQEILMEKKFTEYAIKKEEILQSKMQEEAKAARILELQQAETRDMKDILTRPQHELYVVKKEQRLKEQVKIEP